MALTPIDAAERAALQRALAAEGLPTDDIDAPGRTFFRLVHDGATAGYAGLEIRGLAALVRSVVILPERRGRGAGLAAVRELIATARARGLTDLWLLTLSAADFFAKVGFERADRATAPPAIASTQEFKVLCPAAAVCMRLRLT